MNMLDNEYRDLADTTPCREAIERLLQSPTFESMSSTRAGALFTLHSLAIRDLCEYQTDTMSGPERRLLGAWLRLVENAPDLATDMAAVEKELEIGRGAILQAVGKLIARGCVHKDFIAYYPKCRSVSLYVLAPQGAHVRAHIDGRIEESGVFCDEESLTEEAVHLRYDPVWHRILPWKGERLTVFHLIALLRNSGGNRQFIEARIRQGEGTFLARASAAEGTVLPEVRDLEPLIALMTLAWKDIEVAGGALGSGLFQIDLHDVCTALSLTAATGNLRSIYRRLTRWRYTRFALLQDRYGSFKWAEGLFTVGSDFSVLSHLSPIGRKSPPKRVQFRFCPQILAALCRQDRVLTIHGEALRQFRHRPLAMQIYLWCRRVVKHHHEGRTYTLEHMRAEVAPLISLKQFRRELVAELSKGAFPGYDVTYAPDNVRPKHDALIISANRSDRILGEDSAYARRARGSDLIDRRMELRAILEKSKRA